MPRTSGRPRIGDRVSFQRHVLIRGRPLTFTERGVVEIVRRDTAVIRVYGYTREVPHHRLKVTR